MNFYNIIVKNITYISFLVLFLCLYYIVYFYFYIRYKKHENIKNIDSVSDNIKNIDILAGNYNGDISHSNKKASPVIIENTEKPDNWRDTYNEIQELNSKIKLNNQLDDLLNKNDIEINDD